MTVGTRTMIEVSGGELAAESALVSWGRGAGATEGPAGPDHPAVAPDRGEVDRGGRALVMRTMTFVALPHRGHANGSSSRPPGAVRCRGFAADAGADGLRRRSRCPREVLRHARPAPLAGRRKNTRLGPMEGLAPLEEPSAGGRSRPTADPCPGPGRSRSGQEGEPPLALPPQGPGGLSSSFGWKARKPLLSRSRWGTSKPL